MNARTAPVVIRMKARKFLSARGRKVAKQDRILRSLVAKAGRGRRGI